MEWLSKLVVKIAEELNNQIYSFRHLKSLAWVGVKTIQGLLTAIKKLIFFASIFHAFYLAA